MHTETQEAWVPIIILTGPVLESVMNEAIAEVQQLSTTVGDICRIRVELLGDD